MSLDPRAIAVQGLAYGVLLVAAQGLLPASTDEQPAGVIAGSRFIPALRPLVPVRMDDRDLLEMMPIILGVLNATR